MQVGCKKTKVGWAVFLQTAIGVMNPRLVLMSPVKGIGELLVLVYPA
jgi:hypothetical protein